MAALERRTGVVRAEGLRYRFDHHQIQEVVYGDLPEELLEEAKARTPLGRFTSLEDVSAAVAFLASDEAAFITGQVLAVDGGLVMM